jgi:glycosyltransferase involved in cell wall biosynthesis
MVQKLSVFLPSYNEEKNLPYLIEECDKYLSKNLDQYEIIVIDDGSTDNTAPVVSELSEEYKNLRLVKHEGNQGYGQAIRTGIKESKYPWTFFMDSDNQFKIEDLEKFLNHDDYDLIIGYRLKRNDPLKRLIASRIYGMFVKALFGLTVRDIDCAFKLMRRDAVANLGFVSNSFFASTELLVKAKKKDLKIKEIGVHHYPRKEGVSTVTLARVKQSLLELGKLYAALP